MSPEKHVAVLLGGWSAERDVSLSTGRECAKGLTDAGYRVTMVDVDRDVAARLATLRPDVCFNALHGVGGEDGTIQGLLNILQIPYTHSGILASALAMDKPKAKQIFVNAGIRVPEGRVMHRKAVVRGDGPEPPYVVKPANQGSSVGVTIVHPGDNALPFANGHWPFGDEVLVERFVPGRELTVAVMGDRPLAVTEIRPKAGFYDYSAKYTDGMAVHDVPARIPAEITQAALSQALTAHRALGCRSISRADFRWDDSAGLDGLYMLEVNTQPGMTPLSLVPEQAASVGIAFAELMRWIVEEARCDA